MALQPEEVERHTLHPLVLLALVVLVIGASLGESLLALAAWAACDVGINSGANFMGVAFFGLPLLLAGNSVLAVASAWTARRLRIERSNLTVLTAAVLLIAGGCLLLGPTFIIPPADYPSPFCIGNVPPWWPAWLPS